MFKYSDLDYDSFYSSKQCLKEDAEIKKVLDGICQDHESVLDLGAGTGLVASMIGNRCRVIQVESDADMRKQNPYPNFIVSDAAAFVNAIDAKAGTFDHVVSLFALDYMKRGTLTKSVALASGSCVFVVYDKPYLKESASIYSGRKFDFIRSCGLKKLFLDREIDSLIYSGYHVSISSLCGEPYYKMVVVSR